MLSLIGGAQGISTVLWSACVVPKIGISRWACAQAVAYVECVCTIPPIDDQFLYRIAWVFVSDDGRRLPATVFPSKSTITIFSGDRSSYGTPLGLIAKTPRARSTALTFPKVKTTNPNFGNCMFAV